MGIAAQAGAIEMTQLIGLFISCILFVVSLIVTIHVMITFGMDLMPLWIGLAAGCGVGFAFSGSNRDER
jgi:1,4-dihydroxy-2-naphthoate octaprenyltransferase